MKNSIAYIIDEHGDRWFYEGTIDGNDMFTKEAVARPKLLTEKEAYMVAVGNAGDNETAGVKKV